MVAAHGTTDDPALSSRRIRRPWKSRRSRSAITLPPHLSSISAALRYHSLLTLFLGSNLGCPFPPSSWIFPLGCTAGLIRRTALCDIHRKRQTPHDDTDSFRHGSLTLLTSYLSRSPLSPQERKDVSFEAGLPSLPPRAHLLLLTPSTDPSELHSARQRLSFHAGRRLHESICIITSQRSFSRFSLCSRRRNKCP